MSRPPASTPPAPDRYRVLAWSRLHGLITLEIEGNFASMGLDPDLLFQAEVAAILAGVSAR
jgi:hypothetical protein